MATIMRCVGFAQYYFVSYMLKSCSLPRAYPQTRQTLGKSIFAYIYGLRGALTTIDMLSELPEKRDSNMPRVSSAMASKKTPSVTSNGRSSLKSKPLSRVSTMSKGKKASLPRYP